MKDIIKTQAGKLYCSIVEKMYKNYNAGVKRQLAGSATGGATVIYKMKKVILEDGRKVKYVYGQN